jgi:hypothetical protein
MDYLTEDAIAKFRTMEHLLFRLDVAEYALEKALAEQIDMNAYFIETEKIRTDFEARRKAYVASHRLPR